MQSLSPGALKSELDTPALCVDLDALEANIRDMAAVSAEAGVAWRPHAKCHKSPVIARQLIAAGAAGITCAKLGEAEVMAGGGVTDVLVANLIAGEKKIARAVELRRRADFLLCIDHLDQAAPLSRAMAAAGQAVRVLIEVDIGMGRAGAATGEPSLALALQIADLPGLRLCGLMGYEGHLLRIEDVAEKERRIHAALDLLAETKALLQQSGLPCPIVSCGGTGSYVYSARHPAVTEVQAGGGIFMDAFYRRQCGVHWLRDALTVLTTVVGRPAADRAIIDAGRKTMNMELEMPVVAGREGIAVTALSAEHGILRLSPGVPLAISERLAIIPGYSDLTMVLHDRIHGFRGDRLEVVWPIAARGRLD